MKTLKKISQFSVLALVLAIAGSSYAQAQVEVSTGADLVSTYVWRGSAFSGPSFQPSVELSAGSFAIGAWGSQGYDGFQEMDLYAGYSFDFGLYLGITDYYYPGTPYFSYTEDADNGDFSSHAFEINAGYEIESFSLSANFILNEASGAGSSGGDLYFEAGYAFDPASVFLGAGNGWHTNEALAGETPNLDGSFDDVFSVVNLGASTSKEIVITDTFTVPVTGSVILNPYHEQFFIVIGFSF